MTAGESRIPDTNSGQDGGRDEEGLRKSSGAPSPESDDAVLQTFTNTAKSDSMMEHVSSKMGHELPDTREQVGHAEADGVPSVVVADPPPSSSTDRDAQTTAHLDQVNEVSENDESHLLHEGDGEDTAQDGHESENDPSKAPGHPDVADARASPDLGSLYATPNEVVRELAPAEAEGGLDDGPPRAADAADTADGPDQSQIETETELVHGGEDATEEDSSDVMASELGHGSSGSGAEITELSRTPEADEVQETDSTALGLESGREEATSSDLAPSPSAFPLSTGEGMRQADEQGSAAFGVEEQRAPDRGNSDPAKNSTYRPAVDDADGNLPEDYPEMTPPGHHYPSDDEDAQPGTTSSAEPPATETHPREPDEDGTYSLSRYWSHNVYMQDNSVGHPDEHSVEDPRHGEPGVSDGEGLGHTVTLEKGVEGGTEPNEDIPRSSNRSSCAADSPTLGSRPQSSGDAEDEEAGMDTPGPDDHALEPPLPSHYSLGEAAEDQTTPAQHLGTGGHAAREQYELEDQHAATVHGQDDLFDDDDRSEVANDQPVDDAAGDADASEKGTLVSEHPGEAVGTYVDRDGVERQLPDLTLHAPTPSDVFPRRSWLEEVDSYFEDIGPEAGPETPPSGINEATQPSTDLDTTAIDVFRETDSHTDIGITGGSQHPESPQTPTERQSLASSEYVTPEHLAARDGSGLAWRATDDWTPKSQDTRSTLSSSPPSPLDRTSRAEKQMSFTTNNLPTGLSSFDDRQRDHPPLASHHAPSDTLKKTSPWQRREPASEPRADPGDVDSRLHQGGTEGTAAQGSLFQRMRNLFEQPPRTSTATATSIHNPRPIRTRPSSNTWLADRANRPDVFSPPQKRPSSVPNGAAAQDGTETGETGEGEEERGDAHRSWFHATRTTATGRSEH